jgi:hypothetical protein
MGGAGGGGAVGNAVGSTPAGIAGVVADVESSQGSCAGTGGGGAIARSGVRVRSTAAGVVGPTDGGTDEGGGAPRGGIDASPTANGAGAAGSGAGPPSAMRAPSAGRSGGGGCTGACGAVSTVAGSGGEIRGRSCNGSGRAVWEDPGVSDDAPGVGPAVEGAVPTGATGAAVPTGAAGAVGCVVRAAPGVKAGNGEDGSGNCFTPGSGSASALCTWKRAAGLSTRWKTSSATAGSIAGGRPATKVGSGANAWSGKGSRWWTPTPSSDSDSAAVVPPGAGPLAGADSIQRENGSLESSAGTNHEFRSGSHFAPRPRTTISSDGTTSM